MQHEVGDYPANAEIYDYDHNNKGRDQGRDSGYSDRQHDERDDMW